MDLTGNDDTFGDTYRPVSMSMNGAPTIPLSNDSFDTEPSDPFAGSSRAPPMAGVTGPLITCKVTEPEKHGDSVDGYITYNIVSQTALPSFAARNTTVRRRYQDFIWLREQLVREHPASIVPPLPEKHRLGYLGRFSDQFVSRRQNALQRFLDRVCAHPVLHRSDSLRLFLEAKTWGLETAKQLKKTDFMEELGSAVINTLYKVKNPDERFVAVDEYVVKLHDNLVNLEKIYARIVKRQAELAESATEYASTLSLMSSTEERLGPVLQAAGQAHEKMVLAYKTMNETIETEVLDNLRDYIIYCYAIKVTVKERAQRQILYEELCEQVDKELAEVEALSHVDTTAGRPSQGWNPFKSNDPAHIAKLKETLEESQRDMRQADEINKSFSLIVMQELDLFNRSKTNDFRAIFGAYVRANVVFLKRGQEVWNELLPVVQAVQSDEKA